MKWNNFTNKYIKEFIPNKYNLHEESNLLLFIRNERNLINKFIVNNPNLEIKIESINSKDINDIFIELTNTPWVYNKVIDEINNLNKNYYYKWKFNNTENFILIKSNKDDISDKIKLIAYIIEYIKYKNNNNKPVKIYIVLSNLKKYFPNNNEIIGTKHANTGYNNSLTNIIFIWRYEEYEKVIFHEIMHYLDLDYRHHVIDNIDNLNINGPTTFFEAITDYYGIIYNIIYVSIFSKLSIKLLIEIELGFIKNQAMHMNDFLNLKNWDTQIKINIKSPVISYYILKYLLFEYSINNNIPKNIQYNNLIKIICKNNFIQQKYIKLKSSRMSIIQLSLF